MIVGYAFQDSLSQRVLTQFVEQIDHRTQPSTAIFFQTRQECPVLINPYKVLKKLYVNGPKDNILPG